jgi:N-acyl-D-amino-acid deacylase
MQFRRFVGLAAWITLVCGLMPLEQLLAFDEPTPRASIILKAATIHPGDGSPGFAGHLVVGGDRIVSVLKESDPLPDADTIIDCSGLVISPGFIDLHNHSDEPIQSQNTRANVNYLLQGCTTIITGNCGSGPVDVAEYFSTIEKQGAGTNVGHLLPQGSLRSQVMGKENRKPTDEELQSMRDLAAKAMLDGAFGISTGLIYIPGTLTGTEELIEVNRIVGQHHGIYVSHIRNEGDRLLPSIEEAIQIGKAGDTPVHISHLKANGRANWGTLRVATERIEKARMEGLRVTADQYPYIASSTSLEATLLPDWCREGGRERLKERLSDPAASERIRTDVVSNLEKASRIQLASCSMNRAWIGKSIDEIAAELNQPAADVVLEIERHGGASVVNFGMNEEDLRHAMPFPWLATASDGGAKIPTASQPHPRSGRFPARLVTTLSRIPCWICQPQFEAAAVCQRKFWG